MHTESESERAIAEVSQASTAESFVAPQSRFVSKKYHDPTWDFREHRTKYSVHGVHPYPAMMIPEVAKKLILKYSQPGNVILDPFCGSGTVLVESKLNGRNTVGTDINPLAVLLSKVKTSPINPTKLRKASLEVINGITYVGTNEDPPSFQNIEFWFKPKVIRDLTNISYHINQVSDVKIRKFLLVCFSLTVRLASNTRNGEFKLFRIPKEKLSKHNPDSLRIFREVLFKNISKMEEFYKSLSSSKVFVKVLQKDMRKPLPFASNYFDALITSPPYGDSRTTVAYGQFSRLSSQWLGFENANSIDKLSLGGKPANSLHCELPSHRLTESVSAIGKEDEERAKEVLSFYIDFYECLKEVNRLLKRKAIACFIVGNRMVKGYRIPTDEIFVELFEKDFDHLETVVRNIPSKTMPLQNSPTNLKGVVSDTMHKENIVILRKR
ncbi:MAG: site-specific DNA-methyltransferase [candidate division Zixibacteria bacterium]|nr:site-specific DNA-methyltransferase [candidate division Zixibacteria bacterium]